MIVVKVTREDIRKGRPGMWHMCPVALALNRAIGGAWSVDGRCAENKDGGRIALPHNVIDFIRRFDELIEGSPFEFHVEL